MTEAEGQFAELTTALADLTAKRNQLEANVRTHRDKLARLDQEIANVAAEEQKLADETGGFGDLDELTATVETAEQTLAASEAAAQASEAAHIAARQTLEILALAARRSRQARAAARYRGAHDLQDRQRRDQELWPPIIDGITVDKGFEKAIGAALGDDLDAPVDPSAPMRWTNAGVTDGDPELPEGVVPLANHVQAPAELARRLAQIGVVPRERGAELVSQLKTGQRLVSPEGDVWRWDGFVAAAHAPTAPRGASPSAPVRRHRERAGAGPLDAQINRRRWRPRVRAADGGEHRRREPRRVARRAARAERRA